MALLIGLALTWTGYSAQAAGADPTVVSATIYQGSAGGVSSPSVTLSTLQSSCPPYSGPGTSPLYLYPGGQPYQPATNSSWAVSTVVQCGLQVPLNDVTSVQVYSPPPSTRGFEVPLTSAQLTDASQFQDPQAPQALPVISHDGSEDQNTYTRPYLGGSDDNAGDQVTESGPIALVVYENGSPLQVTATSNIVSQTAAAMSVAFGASVQGPNGTVPASDLTWSWNFGDSATSTDPAPTHSYPPGAYFVTVQVTDARAGLGGTASIKVSAPSPGGSGGPPPGGAGAKHKAKSSTGTDHGTGAKPGGPVRKQKASKPRTSVPPNSNAAGRGAGRANATTPPSQTITSTRTSPVPSTTSAPAPGPSGPPAHTHPTPTRRPATRARPIPTSHGRRPAPRPAASGPHAREVSGLLISNVKPLAPGASPLVRSAAASLVTAPAVREAVAGSSAAAVGAGLTVALLLGLGAYRELSWRHRWRPRPRGSPGAGR